MTPNENWQLIGLHNDLRNNAGLDANHNQSGSPNAVPGDDAAANSFVPQQQVKSRYPPINEATEWYNRYRSQVEPVAVGHYKAAGTEERTEEPSGQQTKSPTPRKTNRPIPNTNRVSKNPGKLPYGGNEDVKRMKQKHKATQIHKMGILNDLIDTITNGGAGDVVEQAMRECGIEDKAVLDHVLGRLGEYLEGERSAAVTTTKNKN